MFKTTHYYAALFGIWLLAISYDAYASLEQKAGVWTKISKRGVFSTLPLGYEFIVEDRQYVDTATDNQFNIGGFLTQQFTPTQQLALGYQYFYFCGEAPGLGGRGENRISQRWNTQLPAKISLLLQSTLQERQRQDLSEWNYRLREKLTYTTPLSHTTFEFHDEILLNLNNPDWVTNQFLSENRAFFGYNYSFNKKTSVKWGYLNRSLFGRNNHNRMQHIVAMELNFS